MPMLPGEAGLIAIAEAVRAVAEAHTATIRAAPELAETMAEREQWWQEEVWRPLGDWLTGGREEPPS